MTKQEFIQYLETPGQISPEVIPQLKELLAAFPSFQTGHVLLLKGLYETGDVLYEKYLSKIAAYAGNREVLYDYIMGRQKQALSEPEILPLNQETVPPPVLDSAAKAEPAERKNYFDTVTVSNDYFNLRNAPAMPGGSDQFDGVRSFSQWLDLMSGRPHQAEPEAPESPEKSKKWELIDSFISEKHDFNAARDKQIDREISSGDLSTKSVTEKEEFMTETLARIYIKQKNYNKALHIFKKLSLKYPEKSIYFAGQIKIVEDLKTNEK